MSRKFFLLYVFFSFMLGLSLNSKASSFPQRGLFIGSFDPITNAHILVLQAALGQLDIQHMTVVVNSSSGKDYSASIEERTEMVRAALSESFSDKISFSVIEEPAIGKRELAFQLAAKSKDKILFQIAGDDVQPKAKELFGDLPQIKTFILPRIDEKSGQLGRLQSGFNLLESEKLSSVSSTFVKKRRLQGQSIDGLVPPSVLSRIEEKKLYRALNSQQIAERHLKIAKYSEHLETILKNPETRLRFNLNLSSLAEISKESLDQSVSVISNTQLNLLQSEDAVIDLIARRLIYANPQLSKESAFTIQKIIQFELRKLNHKIEKNKLRCESVF
jgi:cytidyltransferase-like protein